MYNTESTTRSEDFPDGREYLAYIYVEYGRESDKYYFGNVTAGDENRTKLPKVEKGKNLYAWVHTHGAYRSNTDIESDYFSGGFRGGGDDEVTQKLGIDGYLITLDGTLKRLDHTGNISSTVTISDSNPSIRIIANDIPHN